MTRLPATTRCTRCGKNYYPQYHQSCPLCTVKPPPKPDVPSTIPEPHKPSDAELRLESALQEIIDWSKAYPLEQFPEPDLVKARKILKEHGMTLDAITADAMRHVITEVAEIARRGLESEVENE